MRYIYAKAPAPTKVMAGAIWIHEGLVKNWTDIIKTIEKEAEEGNGPTSWVAAQTADGRTDGLRRNQILNLTATALNGSEACRKVHNQIAALIDECVGAYAQSFNTEITECEDFAMLKYQGSTHDHYDAHYDGGPATKRWISAIVYLNEDYEGGELEFVNYGVKIKPKAGSLLIFPSNYAYAHIAHTVESGTKYAIVTWLHN